MPSRRKTQKKRRVGKGGNDEGCSTTFCKKYYVPRVKEQTRATLRKAALKMDKKNVKAFLQKSEESLKRSEPMMQELCESLFCNTPDCKDTMFEPGPRMSQGAIDQLKKTIKQQNPVEKDRKIVEKLAVNMSHKMRERIFQGKTNVLKDGFYTGLPGAADLKKKGAISGCALMTI